MTGAICATGCRHENWIAATRPGGADIFFGNNIAVSLFLLISGLGFLVFAGKGGLEGAGRRLLLLNSLGMAGVAIISSVYFFPLPAACTGLAAVLGFVAARKLS